MHKTFDVVVIGAGTGGQTAALELAAEGLKVAIVEQSSSPGGTCALHGCQAKKYFYEVAEIAAKSIHLEGLGITGQPRMSWAQISAAKNKFTAPGARKYCGQSQRQQHNLSFRSSVF